MILGGQLLSLFLSLMVTPVAYSIWDDLSHGVKRLFRGRRPKPVEERPLDLVPAGVNGHPADREVAVPTA